MAAAADDRNRSLKQALVESLTAILSPDQQARQMAEEQLKVLEVTDEFGVHLAELTIDREGALAIRQLASVILKQYVEAHWTLHGEKFRPPETTDAAKAEIRRLLPGGLQESISKVRSSVAYAISAIAHWDWPEAWPDLFGHLMKALTSGDGNLVHGAMRVLTEFCREVTDIQMPHVAPVILPEMYKIFIHAEVCLQMLCYLSVIEALCATLGTLDPERDCRTHLTLFSCTLSSNFVAGVQHQNKISCCRHF
ncbi:Importin 9 [Desmophyllum pertusum]|uniref:Importin 9 n=1 Tax=Desmophyllum pertusum TaxID=174260 RepID=A0A9W9Y971_9CNID|nr:Importin 9 [Desmophyllum pertusum]